MAARATRRILLIIDEVPLACRVLTAILSDHFDGVLTAGDPAEARDLLVTGAVTHVLCCCKAGPSSMLSSGMVAECRAEHPEIERLVMIAGDDTAAIDPPPEVDHVLRGATDHKALLAALDVNGAIRRNRAHED